ncbi:MAG: DNA polymerase III subunit gamma/tau, partial [Pseudoflavonifractor sp.]
NVLTLYTDSDFTRSMLNKPGVLSVVSKAAAALLNREMRTVLTVGQAPAPVQPVGEAPAAAAPIGAAEPHDDLDDLLAFGAQFDNITTD